MRRILMIVLVTLSVVAPPATAGKKLAGSGPVDRLTAWTVYWVSSTSLASPALPAGSYSGSFIADGPEATLAFRAKNRAEVNSTNWLEQRIDNVCVVEKSVFDANLAATHPDYWVPGQTVLWFQNIAPQDLLFLDTFDTQPDPRWNVDSDVFWVDPASSLNYPSAALDFSQAEHTPQFTCAQNCVGGSLGIGTASSTDEWVEAEITVDGLQSGVEYVLSFWWYGKSDGDPGPPFVTDFFVDVNGHDLFRDVATGALAENAATAASAWADVDADGREDLYLANFGSPNVLLRVLEDGTFVDSTPLALAVPDASVSAAWGDADKDGYPELYVSNLNQDNDYFLNYGGLDFEERFTLGALDPLTESGPSRGITWGDLNRDGWSDLLLAREASEARRFQSLSADDWEPSGLTPQIVGRSLCLGDVDGDGDTDIVAIEENGPNRFFRFDGEIYVADPTAGLDAETATRCGAFVDFDNDGDLDFFEGNFANPSRLLENDGQGKFTPLSSSGVEFFGVEAAQWFDYDQDGWQDLYIVRSASPEPNVLLHNGQAAGFTLVDEPKVALDGLSLSVSAADYDGDGDIDLYLGRQNAPNQLLQNRLPDPGHWLKVKLVGTASDRNGVGARIDIDTSAGLQMREVQAGGQGGSSQSSPIAHFGLGNLTEIDRLTVRWPSGIVTVFYAVPVDRTLVVVEGSVVAVPELRDSVAASLRANIPNPFNPSTAIRFALEREGQVELTVHDLAGRRVKTLSRDAWPRGEHQIRWHGRDDAGRGVASGAYVVRMKALGIESTRRIVLVK